MSFENLFKNDKKVDFDEGNIEEAPKVVEEEKKDESANLEVKKSRKQQILDSFGGIESNVPINSPYWKLKN